MKVAVFSTKSYDQRYLERANEQHRHELTFFEPRLVEPTAALAAGHDAVCAFVNDRLDGAVLRALHAQGTRRGCRRTRRTRWRSTPWRWS